MAPFEDFLQRATAPGPDRQLPGCAVIAANADGMSNKQSLKSRIKT
jgi:hypothetical protein